MKMNRLKIFEAYIFCRWFAHTSLSWSWLDIDDILACGYAFDPETEFNAGTVSWTCCVIVEAGQIWSELTFVV